MGRHCVDIAASGRGVEGRAGGVVGEVFKVGAVSIGVAEAAGFGIAGKAGTVLANPDTRAALKFGGKVWIFAAQSFHAGDEALGIELVDGESAVTALRAALAADEPWAGAARGIG